jgi:wyosine [tRNA(Phe)-imidazoG37] synthetase (radical SAM superfamily)
VDTHRQPRVVRLDVHQHDRYPSGARYVYPVVSRRAGGVSIGVNLNPNDACNWRCVYCQVPGLTRGVGPAIELDVLRQELATLLDDVVRGDFMRTRVPEGARRLNDVAFSGNGEPTSSPHLCDAIEIAGQELERVGLAAVKLVLITNGSLVSRPGVQRALARLGELGGEVWLKIDSATERGTKRINSVSVAPAKAIERLALASARCSTWVQTCLFAWDGEPPAAEERAAYLDLLRTARARGVPLGGVLLYGLARPSQQPEAGRLSRVSDEFLAEFARAVESTGYVVKVSA